MATITIVIEPKIIMPKSSFKGIGNVTSTYCEFNTDQEIERVKLTIPRMSETRFNNVVKRVLEKNLTEQGITPISITYSE